MRKGTIAAKNRCFPTSAPSLFVFPYTGQLGFHWFAHVGGTLIFPPFLEFSLSVLFFSPRYCSGEKCILVQEWNLSVRPIHRSFFNLHTFVGGGRVTLSNFSRRHNGELTYWQKKSRSVIVANSWPVIMAKSWPVTMAKKLWDIKRLGRTPTHKCIFSFFSVFRI